MAQKLVCTACGHFGEPKEVTKGSGLIEIILWFFFIVPGIIYSIWRRSNKPKVCRVCGSTALIPSTSPMAQRLIAEKQIDESPDIKTLSEDVTPLIKWGIPVFFIVFGVIQFSLPKYGWLIGICLVVIGVLLLPNLPKPLHLKKWAKTTTITTASIVLVFSYILYWAAF